MSDAERNGGRSPVVLSFLIGAVSGGALAVLYAPRSGRETRELLGAKLRETGHRSRALGERALKKSKQVAGQATSYVGRGVERGREVLGDGRGRLASSVEAGRQAYRAHKAKA